MPEDSTKTLSLRSVEPFQPYNESSSAPARSKRWISRFQTYLMETGVDTEQQKKAVFLHLVGEDVVAILENSITTDDKDTAKSLMEKVTLFLEPRMNVPFERFEFRNTLQETGESVDQWHTQLRTKATDCKFGAMEDEMIRDQIVAGCQSTALRKKLLREVDLTLAVVLSSARLLETSQEHAVKMLKTDIPKQTQREMVKTKISNKIKIRKL